VIIPVLNGERTIKECLDSLLRMDYPKERREIIVVDNGSTDRTADIVKQYPVRYVMEEKRGIPPARNRGIDASNGQIVVFIDADCIATTICLRELIHGFDIEEVGAVAGEVVAFPPKTPTERYMAIYKPRWNEQNLSNLEKPYFITACLAIRREVFEEIGSFDPKFSGVAGSDVDFSWRFFERSRFKFSFRPKAVVFHRHRDTASALFKRHLRFGQGQALLILNHPRKVRWGWKQEINAYKDLLLTIILLVRSTIFHKSKNKEMSESSYQYFELIRKLSERIGFTYASIRRLKL
jgi:glycosyltransferase involved in cell wall biosynthesis